MRSARLTAPLLTACALSLASCGVEHRATERAEPTFIYVELLEDDPGTAEAPRAFSSEATEIAVRITTLDVNGDPWPFEGDLTLQVRPGKVTNDPKVPITGSTWEGAVPIKNGFGPTRIWASDLGDKDVDSGRAPSFATGVSDPLYYELPTIGEINRIDDHTSNQLNKEFAEIRCLDRDVRVSYVGTNGFWVSDLLDEVGQHNALFLYTFSAPDDAVEVGRRLTLLTGNDQEYLGATQFSFPEYEVSDEPAVQMPGPVTFDPCAEDDVLEGYESAIVRLEDLKIPESFVEGTEDYNDYIEYGQWPLTTGDCTIYADSTTALPTFYPTDHVGEELDYIQGILTEIYGQWIIIVRDASDIPSTLQRPGTAPYGTLASRPAPRKAP